MLWPWRQREVYNRHRRLLHPGDPRRTFITEALATGTPLATVEAAAGYANGETTLRCAQAVDARKARKELRLRHG